MSISPAYQSDGVESHAPDTAAKTERVPVMAPERSTPGWEWWALRAVGVLIVAVIVAAGVYEVSNRVAASYQSSATVRVAVQTTSGISDPAVTAANDLASQFAQLASSTPVLESAAHRLGAPVTVKDLEGHVTAGTIAAQNLIRVSVTAASPAAARRRATAVARAFVFYLNRINRQQVKTYQSAVASRLKPLGREIAAARKQLLSKDVEVQHNATLLLSALLNQQQTVINSVAQSSAAAQPSIQLISRGAGASKVSPKPSLYAAIGFIATLFLLGRFLYVIGVRKTQAREAPV